MKRILFILALLLGFNSLAKAEFGLMYVKAELDIKDKGKGTYYIAWPYELVAMERCQGTEPLHKKSKCLLEQMTLDAYRKRYRESAQEPIQLYQKLYPLYEGLIASEAYLFITVAEIKAIRPIEIIFSSSLYSVAHLPPMVYDSIVHIKPSLCLDVDMYGGETGTYRYTAYVYNKALIVKDVYKICAQHARALQHYFYEYSMDALILYFKAIGKVEIMPKLEAEIKRNAEVKELLRAQGIYIIRRVNPC